MKIRVALHHMAAVLHVLRHHEGAGPDRPTDQRQSVRVHSGLRVKRVSLPRHRRRERERQPVLPLRILALDAHAQRVAVKRLRTGQRPVAKIKEGLVRARFGKTAEKLLIFGLDQFAVFFQPDQVFGEGGKDRRFNARRGVALERVDIVFSHQLACALLIEVPWGTLVAHLRRCQVVIQVLALVVLRKRGMRRVANALFNAHVVDAFGDLLRRRIVGQALASSVEVIRLDHFLRRLGDQDVGTLEVVIRVQRLVSRVGVGSFRIAVRRSGIEVTRRAFVERVEHRIRRRGTVGVRAVVAAAKCDGECHKPGKTRQGFRCRLTVHGQTLLYPAPARCATRESLVGMIRFADRLDDDGFTNFHADHRIGLLPRHEIPEAQRARVPASPSQSASHTPNECAPIRASALLRQSLRCDTGPARAR
jgi:hypothetical protein